MCCVRRLVGQAQSSCGRPTSPGALCGVRTPQAWDLMILWVCQARTWPPCYVLEVGEARSRASASHSHPSLVCLVVLPG